MAAIGRQFGITKTRVMQILHQEGKVKKHKLNGRTAFTGVHLTPATKDAVKKEAQGEEISISAFISQVVTEELKRRGVTIVEIALNEIDVPLPLEG